MSLGQRTDDEGNQIGNVGSAEQGVPSWYYHLPPPFMVAMKKCPFCAEEILSDALKCKHCHEVLSNTVEKVKTKHSSTTLERIVMGLFACMVLLSITGAISRHQSIITVLFGAFLIYLLWFYPIKLASKLCAQKNRNPNKGVLVVILTGWIGYIILYLTLKTRDPRTGRLS